MDACTAKQVIKKQLTKVIIVQDDNNDNRFYEVRMDWNTRPWSKE